MRKIAVLDEEEKKLCAREEGMINRGKGAGIPGETGKTRPGGVDCDISAFPHMTQDLSINPLRK